MSDEPEATTTTRTYTIEHHRVWVKTVEAESRKKALQLVEEEMSEEVDAENYNYSVVKKGSVKP